MFKLFNIDRSKLQENASNHYLFEIISVVIAIVVSFVLASRAFGIAKDDINYLNYFEFAKNIELDNYLTYFLEEPLWRFYTMVMVQFSTPIFAFRFTVFISVFLFLLSINRIDNRLILVVLLVFVLHPDLATQMYFNQLRQGLALSIFLFLTVYGKKPIIGGILAVLIHTSFIFPLAIIFLVTRVNSISRVCTYSIIFIVLLYLNLSYFDTLDLGRRSDSYEFEGKFNINYYILILLRYVPIIYFLYFYGHSQKFNFWFRLALSSFVIIIPFTLFYNAAGRLTYYLSVFFLIATIANIKNRGGQLSILYLFLFLAIDLVLSFSILERWSLILGL